MSNTTKTRFAIALDTALNKLEIEERQKIPYLCRVFKVSQPSARAWLMGISLPDIERWSEFKKKLGVDISKISIATNAQLSMNNNEQVIAYDFMYRFNDIDFISPELNLGSDTILLFSEKAVNNNYQLHEINSGKNSTAKILGKVTFNGLEYYLKSPDNKKDYSISEIKSTFIGSLVGMRVINNEE